jgi:hypothetical protein
MEYIIVCLIIFNIQVFINAFIVNRALKWLLRDERLNAEYMKLTNVRLEKQQTTEIKAIYFEEYMKLTNVRLEKLEKKLNEAS